MLDMECSNFHWIKKHLNAIYFSYKRAPFFEEIYTELEEIYNGLNSPRLVNINIEFIKYAFKKFRINVPVFRISELKTAGFNFHGVGGEFVLSMAGLVNADVVVAGQSGKSYLNPERFSQNDIALVFQDFKHPTYNQFHGSFMPYMSFIDLLFNYGDEAVNVLPESSYIY